MSITINDDIKIISGIVSRQDIVISDTTLISQHNIVNVTIDAVEIKLQLSSDSTTFIKGRIYNIVYTGSSGYMTINTNGSKINNSTENMILTPYEAVTIYLNNVSSKDWYII